MTQKLCHAEGFVLQKVPVEYFLKYRGICACASTSTKTNDFEDTCSLDDGQVRVFGVLQNAAVSKSVQRCGTA